MKRIFSFVLFMILVCNVFTLFLPIETSEAIETGNTLYVGGSGSGNYTKIQDAIDNASDGDTVFVYNGTYVENAITINKQISLTGEDEDTTIIDGGYDLWLYGYLPPSIVTFKADGVRMGGFTIQTSNNKFTGGGLTINSNNNTISGNNFKNYGIYLEKSSFNQIISNHFNSVGITIHGDALSHWNTHEIENNDVNGKSIFYFKNTMPFALDWDGPFQPAQIILANCSGFPLLQGQQITIEGVQRGIQLGFCSHNVISQIIINNTSNGICLQSSWDNTISANTITKSYSAISLSGNSFNNTIEKNVISSNSNSISLHNSSGNIISDNILSESTWRGINLFYHSDYNTVSRNSVSRSICGIYCDYSSNNTIIENNITGNFEGVRMWISSSNNLVYHNNFINNTLPPPPRDVPPHNWNAVDNGNLNIWYSSVLHEGNYWDDYDGNDANSDGIGDIPYNISNGQSQDRYPLMKPLLSMTNLLVKLSTDKLSYKMNETVTIRITVTNLGEEDITLSLSRQSTAYVADFEVLDKHGQRVYLWTNYTKSSHIGIFRIIPPRETVELFNTTWNQANNNGTRLSPGTYTIRGWLTTDPILSANPVTIYLQGTIDEEPKALDFEFILLIAILVIITMMIIVFWKRKKKE